MWTQQHYVTHLFKFHVGRSSAVRISTEKLLVFFFSVFLCVDFLSSRFTYRGWSENKWNRFEAENYGDFPIEKKVKRGSDPELCMKLEM